MSRRTARHGTASAEAADFDVFHLPGLADHDVLRWATVGAVAGTLTLRYPLLRADGVRRLADRLRAARAESLEALPAASIARRVGAVALRFGVPGDPLRERAEPLVRAATGYSPEMVARVLDGMAADWTPAALERLLESEFGNVATLDGFVAQGESLTEAAGDAGRHASRTRRRAFGPVLALNLFAGNVPGVAVTALIRCLLVKAAVLGKTGRSEPVLPVLFAKALHESDAALGGCVAVTYWPGGSAGIERAAFEEADAVIVYGAGETVRDVRARVPATTRLIEHGPGVSVALVGAAALAARAASNPDVESAHTGEAAARPGAASVQPDRAGAFTAASAGRARQAASETAEQVARAVALFDQLGCVSPHAVYVERGGDVDPLGFARLLADALAALAAELPRGSLSAAEAAAILDFRASAEFREIGGADVRVFGATGDAYTVLYDAEPAFEASCLHRSVRVKPIDRLENAALHLEPLRGLLQTVGIAGAAGREEVIATRMAALGACRIAALERMPWPPADWSHDGQRPLRELVRWADLDEARG